MLKRYEKYEGVPCKRFGHTLRYGGGNCVECAQLNNPKRKESVQKYNKSKKAKIADRRYRVSIKNRECQRRHDAKPLARMRRQLRSMVRQALRRKGLKKRHTIAAALGCSPNFFREYIATKFQPGMSWANHGEWHLDHICPLSLFDLTDPVQFACACHYTNYQPLWAADNQKKYNKLLRAA